MTGAEAVPAVGRVVWTPYPGFQTRAIQDGCDETLNGGAAGPGKTDVLIMKALRAAQHVACRGLFLRTQYTDLRDVMDRMMEVYPDAGGKYVPADRRWTFKANGGGTIELGYGKNLAQISRYLGREYTDINFDELGLLADETPWQLLLSRLRSTNRSVPLRARASANPGGVGHGWLKGRYILPWRAAGQRPWRDQATGLVRNYIPGKADVDNPALPSSYWQRLKGLPPALQKAMRDGDWDAGLGLFYPELQGGAAPFIQRTDLPEVLPAWWSYWGGYDWGFRHPAVFLWLARDDQNRIIVLDVLYMHRLDDPDQATQVAGQRYPSCPAHPEGERLPKECLTRAYAGSDVFAYRQAHATQPETVQDVFNRYQVALERANLERVTGSRTIRTALQSGGLVFVDTVGTRRLVNELQSLVPDENKPEAPRKVDANADTGRGGDDGPDALRYALASTIYLPYKPVETVRRGNLTTGVDDDPFLDQRATEGKGNSTSDRLDPAHWPGTVTGFGDPDAY